MIDCCWEKPHLSQKMRDEKLEHVVGESVWQGGEEEQETAQEEPEQSLIWKYCPS